MNKCSGWKNHRGYLSLTKPFVSNQKNAGSVFYTPFGIQSGSLTKAPDSGFTSQRYTRDPLSM